MNSINRSHVARENSCKLKSTWNILHLPVFSFISHRTLNSAGFILWQFKACFLKNQIDPLNSASSKSDIGGLACKS